MKNDYMDACALLLGAACSMWGGANVHENEASRQGIYLKESGAPQVRMWFRSREG